MSDNFKVLEALKGAFSRFKENVITAPEKAGYDAYQRTAEKNKGKAGEGSKADAAKHMAWQAELVKRSGLPREIAIPLVLAAGLGKEVVVDGLGSTLLYLAGEGDNPLPTMKNSVMDMRNNVKGAVEISKADDTAAAASEASDSSVNDLLRSIVENLPYTQEEEPKKEGE
jgi:hypothetical protein